MTYNEFKNKMTEDVKKYVNGKYPGYGVDLKQFEKVNRMQFQGKNNLRYLEFLEVS